MNSELPVLLATVPGKTAARMPGARAQWLGRPAGKEYFDHLAMALERLWVYYQAMHHGLPVATGESFFVQRGEERPAEVGPSASVDSH